MAFFRHRRTPGEGLGPDRAPEAPCRISTDLPFPKAPSSFRVMREWGKARCARATARRFAPTQRQLAIGKAKQGGPIDFCSPIDPCADTTYAVGKYVLQCLGICSAVTPHRTVSTEQGKGLDVAVREFADVLEA